VINLIESIIYLEETSNVLSLKVWEEEEKAAQNQHRAVFKRC
jgi:hypothetical protein